MKKGVYIKMIKYIVLNDDSRITVGSLWDENHTINKIIFEIDYHEFEVMLTTNGIYSAVVSVPVTSVKYFFQSVEDKS